MDTEQFVTALVENSIEETIASVLSVLEREQKQELHEETALRVFYGDLDGAAKQKIRQLIRFSVASAFFKLLVVVDNCDTIEEGGRSGEFELYFNEGGRLERLGEPPNLLHDNLPSFEELIKEKT